MVFPIEVILGLPPLILKKCSIDEIDKESNSEA